MAEGPAGVQLEEEQELDMRGSMGRVRNTRSMVTAYSGRVVLFAFHEPGVCCTMYKMMC